jgi:hypothetical protein
LSQLNNNYNSLWQEYNKKRISQNGEQERELWQGSVAIANHVLFLGQVSLGLLCLRWGVAGSLLETRQRIGASTARDEWQNPVNMRKSTYKLHFSTHSAPDFTP